MLRLYIGWFQLAGSRAVARNRRVVEEVVNGRVHAHITLSDDKKALAGHLEPGTKAFTFIIVTLGVFGDEVDLDRLDDKTW